MAKGNMFQGMARGKVGDVVFSRLDGEQISRVRNRNPRNPKTNKQLYQRAIMATIMAAYSYGKEIFDHSFEGLAVGSANQRMFMKRNAKALRAAMASDLEALSASQVSALVTAPGVSTMIPNGYIIADGSLEQEFFSLTRDNDGNLNVNVPQSASATETAVEYAETNGLVAGDIYTFCLVSTLETDVLFTVGSETDQSAKVSRGQFGFVRLEVRSDIDAAILSSAAKVSDIFIVTGSDNINNLAGIGNTQLVSLYMYTLASNKWAPGRTDNLLYVLMAWGVIRSNNSTGLRSASSMQLVETPCECGLNWEYALAGWKQGATELGDSDLILEGGDV